MLRNLPTIYLYPVEHERPVDVSAGTENYNATTRPLRYHLNPSNLKLKYFIESLWLEVKHFLLPDFVLAMLKLPNTYMPYRDLERQTQTRFSIATKPRLPLLLFLTVDTITILFSSPVWVETSYTELPSLLVTTIPIQFEA